jgi:oligopeptide transport system substrate-binding protein
MRRHMRLRNRFPRAIIRLISQSDWRQHILVVSGLFLLAACQVSGEEPELATRVIMQAGEERVVTRPVEQTMQVAVTPVTELTENPVTLDISLPEGYESLDPQMTIEDNSLQIMENIFVGLTRFNLETNAIEPELATSWEISDDGLVWTFKLRDDVYWIEPDRDDVGLFGEEGTGFRPLRPVTASDVVYSIQRACDPRVPTPDVFILFIIEGCETLNTMDEIDEKDLVGLGVRAIDDQTLEIQLTEPASHFLSVTSMWLLDPVPAELIQELEEDWHLPENIWTSGPFAFGPETSVDNRTVLLRNPFWPIEFSGNVDRVNIFHMDEMEAYQMWDERNLDMSPLPIEEQEAILARHELKADLVSNQQVFYLAYNFQSPAFSIPEIRQAFGWAIDRERLISEVHGDLAQPMRHLAPPGVIGAPPIDEVGTGYSPDRARLAMDSSIFSDCRLMPPITYMVNSSDLALQHAELLRDMWVEELGCNEEQIIIEQVQFGELLANTLPDAGESRPDLWDLGWASYYPDENNWLGDVLHCTDSENRQNRPCDNIDDLIREANENISIDRRWSLYRQIEREFFGEEGIEPITPLYVRADYWLSHGWVTYTPAHFGGEQFDTYFVDAEVKLLERNR